MEQEIAGRLAKIEEQIKTPRKTVWDKLQVLTPILIPLTIAVLGWYFTNRYNANQLAIEQMNNQKQVEIANINASVGQSALIKDLMIYLTSKDQASQNIAIEAILYAAPGPGKRIVEILARSKNDSVRTFAKAALSGKREDLASNLFSDQKQLRLAAAGEIAANWNNDKEVVLDLFAKAKSCLEGDNTAGNCEDGLYNTMVVLSGFTTEALLPYKKEIMWLIERIPPSSRKTQTIAAQISRKLN
jgi:hypothetical protein